jgi:AraC-like DNA-binding protein
VDAIAGLLDGPRAREAFLLRSSLDPPWSLRIRDAAPLTVLSMVRGTAWAVRDGEDPVALHAGDVAVFRGPEPYTVADDPATPPQVAIEPGQECRVLVPGAEKLLETFSVGVRNWGNAVDGETVMLTGTYTLDGEVSGRLLRALPPLLVLRAGEWSCPVVPLLADEIGKDDPGQEAVLDRLLDLLLIAVLRAWFARPDNGSPEWYRAHGDPVVGHALRLLHNNPAHPWTVAELAHETGASRAALARRFTDLVGEPPMAFLTSWRIALAADLLLEPDATLGSVAERVGYGSPFALSTAFKRLRGVSPQEHRRGARASANVPAEARRTA